MTKTRFCSLFLWVAALATVLPLAHGCSDASIQCLGTPVACANRELAECDAGCRIREGCFGGEVSCESLADRPNLCIQVEGCRYLGTCEGDEGCAQLGFTECGETAGCVQVRRCAGAGFSCESTEDSQCELFAQCELGSQCVGSARSCSELDSTSSCFGVPGCYPAETTPSVVP